MIRAGTATHGKVEEMVQVWTGIFTILDSELRNQLGGLGLYLQTAGRRTARTTEAAPSELIQRSKHLEQSD